MSSLAVIVLAAGAASRFGAPKLLQEIDGVSMLRGRIEMARQLADADVFVVLGHSARLLEPHCTGVSVVRNGDWQSGLGNSIAAGVRALPQFVDDVLLLLADQVALTADDLRALINAHSGAKGVTCARYNGVPGVPAVFARSWFPQLLALHGEHGARELLRGNAQVHAIDMPTAALDIDTPEALEKYRQQSLHD